MALPKNITCKEFTCNVIEYILCELDYLRENFLPRERLLVDQSVEMNFIPFYRRIGKAATLFALMHQKKVKSILKQRREKCLRSSRILDVFIQKFSENFFESIDSVPLKWFPVVVLMFCGVIGAIADFCKEFNRLEFVKVCCINMDLTLHSYLEDIEDVGGWQRLYDAADEFATEYDSRFWKNDIYEDEEVLEESG